MRYQIIAGRIQEYFCVGVGRGGGGGQEHNLPNVCNMKRRGVWSVRWQLNDSEQFWMNFLKELKEDFVLQKKNKLVEKAWCTKKRYYKIYLAI